MLSEDMDFVEQLGNYGVLQRLLLFIWAVFMFSTWIFPNFFEHCFHPILPKPHLYIT